MANEQESDFPVSFKVLVVTSDQTCGENVEALLNQCKFEVTTTSAGAEAIKLLRGDKDKFDFVICDEHVADKEDALRLAGIISLKMVKPTAYIHSGNSYAVMCAMPLGVDWLFAKPLTLEHLKHITESLLWRIRNRVDAMMSREDKFYDGVRGEYYYPLEMMPTDDVWPSEVHQKFVAAIKVLGKRARTDTVMELMDVEGLSKIDVANQLKRYRLQQITSNRIVPPVTRYKEMPLNSSVKSL